MNSFNQKNLTNFKYKYFLITNVVFFIIVITSVFFYFKKDFYKQYSQYLQNYSIDKLFLSIGDNDYFFNSVIKSKKITYMNPISFYFYRQNINYQYYDISYNIQYNKFLNPYFTQNEINYISNDCINNSNYNCISDVLNKSKDKDELQNNVYYYIFNMSIQCKYSISALQNKVKFTINNITPIIEQQKNHCKNFNF